MKFFLITLSLTLLIIVGVTACGAQEAAPPTSPPATAALSLLTDPAQATEEAAPTATLPSPPEATATDTPSTPSPEATATGAPSPSSTPSPEATATQTVAPTQTSTPPPTTPPEPVVQLADTSTDRINIRSGPGTDYPVAGQLEPGQVAKVVGRNGDSSWWQINWAENEAPEALGWVFGDLVNFAGDNSAIAVVEVPPPPPTAPPQAVAEAQPGAGEGDPPPAAEAPAEELGCGKDFCVTYQAMVPMAENGGCIGNHSIYITVLEGPPPGRPMDGVVIGDTYNNVEVGSGSHGPGRTEITLWMNSMILTAKRHQDGTPYTSEESFNFTAHDELIPPEVLAANGYCEGNVEKCRVAHQNNQVCRGHYSWRVTFHKFN